MKREQLEKQLIERFGKDGGYIYRCVTNMYARAYYQQLSDYADEAEDLETFLVYVRGDDSLRFSQAYGELGRRLHWPLPIAYDADVLTTYSDAGGVRIGDLSGTATALIPNGYGDGETRVIIGKVNTCMLSLVVSIEGVYQIYAYDCARMSEACDDDYIIEGRFSVYSGEGTVAFVEY